MSFSERITLNATSAEVTLPPTLRREAVNYRAVVDIRNARGEMEATDDDTIYARILKNDGTLLEDRLKSDATGTALDDSTDADWVHAVQGWHEQITSLSAGRYEVFVGVTAAVGDEGQYTLEIGWTERGVHNYASKRFTIGDAADLDDLALEASVTAMQGDVTDILADTADMQPKLGTPAGTDMSADIAAVKAETVLIVEDTADMQPKLGTPEAALVSLSGMVGQGDDAAGNEGTAGETLHAKLRALLVNIAALDAEAGIRKSSFTEYPANADAVMTADPTDGEVDADSTATHPTAPVYVVLHKFDIALPETTEALIDCIFATLKWTGQITTGAAGGFTKWGIAPYGTGNLAGDPPDTVTDITDAVAETTDKVTHSRSGLVLSTAIPGTGDGVELVLMGIASVATEELTATIFESTSLEVTYSR